VVRRDERADQGRVAAAPIHVTCNDGCVTAHEGVGVLHGRERESCSDELAMYALVTLLRTSGIVIGVGNSGLVSLPEAPAVIEAGLHNAN
jgi:hypothetical protein